MCGCVFYGLAIVDQKVKSISIHHSSKLEGCLERFTAVKIKTEMCEDGIELKGTLVHDWIFEIANNIVIC